MSKKLLTTQEMVERLAAKYSSPQYGFLTQVRSCTGYGNPTTADGLAMSLWPSRGLHLIGFEIKASRSDWLTELKKPDKAENIAMYCHQWYIVINDADHIKEGELPVPWGLIVPSGKGLKVIKEAQHNSKAVPPDYDMLAGIFRNVADYTVPKEALATRDKENRDRGIEEGKRESKRIEDAWKKLREEVNDFQKEAGFQISSYPHQAKDTGKAISMVLSGKHLKAEEMVKKLRQRAVNMVKWFDDEVKEWQV